MKWDIDRENQTYTNYPAVVVRVNGIDNLIKFWKNIFIFVKTAKTASFSLILKSDNGSGDSKKKTSDKTV